MSDDKNRVHRGREHDLRDEPRRDPLGPGGVFRALQTIVTILDVVRDMEELCPDLALFNYTNPMAIVCWTADEAPDVDDIHTDIERLEGEKGDINDELVQIESLKQRLPDRKQCRTEFGSDIEETRGTRSQERRDRSKQDERRRDPR